jgi:hypothetical protein
MPQTITLDEKLAISNRAIALKDLVIVMDMIAL